ncbi:MAG: YciI family protein [Micavibrio sp.]|nr:YciI family protein [Micavibrio sp.]
MQFIIMGHDHADAKPRRAESRQAHLDALAPLKDSGRVLYAAALLDDSAEMVGSMIVADFDSRAEVDAYLAAEPYVQNNVWGKIDVTACKVAPSFAKK